MKFVREMLSDTYGVTYAEVKPLSKKAKEILWDYANRDYGDIEDAYTKPSCYKVSSYREIERRAIKTEGYNYDLKVVAKSCHFYSTVYSYTQDGVKYIVKDTPSYTYRLALI